MRLGLFTDPKGFDTHLSMHFPRFARVRLKKGRQDRAPIRRETKSKWRRRRRERRTGFAAVAAPAPLEFEEEPANDCCPPAAGHYGFDGSNPSVRRSEVILNAESALTSIKGPDGGRFVDRLL